MDSIVYAATGHRPPRLGLDYSDGARQKLTAFAEKVLRKLSPAPAAVITGGAQGWDQAVALACMNLGVPFWVAVPFAGQESKWPLAARLFYHALLEKAARVHVVCEGGYSASKFVTRDHWMVDHADTIIALMDDKPEKSGTRHTVEYAISLAKPVINCWPDWSRPDPRV